MLQTLSDMTDDELERVTEKARNDIINISRDRATMLKVFGATKYNKNKTYLQQALETYPEMLADNYCKNILKLIKRKLVKNGRSAKFEVDGKYTFLIPDLYAFCERLFLGTEKPIGLLKDGDVFCQLFQKTKELDCLRSPHLYREHAVRKNVLDDVKRKWFITQGLYTSSYDLVSKLLQFDVDGDKSLVCADNTILEAAKRNTKGIVPIYYEMGTAKPVVVNSQKLHEGLTFAFANCNIGAVSNNITKVWNSNDINLDVIKLQCMESNFLIDAAKTLTKLERPQNMKPVIARHTRAKAPRFFIYAKDKTKEQVEATNGSVVNRLTKFIPDKRIVFDKNAFGVFEYGMLMKNTKIEVLPEIVKLYEEFKMGNKFNINVDDLEHSNIQYIYHKNRESLLSVLDNAYDVSDMLVKYLYGEMRKTDKEALWFMFGNVLLENLKCNLDERYGDSHILCERCAKRMQKINNRQKYCGDCWKELERVRAKENRNKKVRTV
jgi:Zn finger protein HypA/HybF involved in hydrogenase expression